MAPVKDSTYHFDKLKAGAKALVPKLIFRTWDPLTAMLKGVGSRAAEISADLAQAENDWHIDSSKGVKLRRRLENEGVFLLEARAANDGTVTFARATAPTISTTFPVGALKVSPVPDPSKPAANRPVYSNTAPLTIGPGATMWTVAMASDRGGADTNMASGTVLQLVTQANALDTATVAAAFTNGSDDETDDAYRQRGKLEIRSRAKGTDDALIAAALKAGAAFAYTTENFTAGAIPVTLYAANSAGALPGALQTEIRRHLNGDPAALPVLPAARVKGVPVDVQPATTVSFPFSIKLILQPFVIDTPADPKLTTLRADIAANITSYIQDLNRPGQLDRVMRINRVKDICLGYRGRGVLDVDNATFLPAANTTLTAQQMAVTGAITWLA